jgi:hypothetical protein
MLGRRLGLTTLKTCRFAISLAVLALAGSAETSARIYVYAQRDTAARSWTPVSSGGAVIAELKRGTFFAIDVAPGRYSLDVQNGASLIIEARPDEESFIRLDWIYEVGQRPVLTLSRIPASVARNEMRFLSYVSPGKVHSSSVPKTDPREPQTRQLKTRDGQ